MEEIEQRCAQLLRELRRKKALTLRQCEELSEGKFKAVVLGSYERGTRAISLERLQELANFYQVPIRYFFAGEESKEVNHGRRVVFDLRKMKQDTYREDGLDRIKALLNKIAAKRGDWSGEILSIRESDGDFFSIISNDEEIIKKLEFHGYLLDK